MKLLKQSGGTRQYALEQREGVLLRMLIEGFPPPAGVAVKISRTGAGSKSAERQRLLDESLAGHRQELKTKGRKLLATRLKSTIDGLRLSLTPDQRETLLQLLNDIRVESWHELGEPENLDTPPPKAAGGQLRQHQLMHLAGYFEWQLLEGEVED